MNPNSNFHLFNQLRLPQQLRQSEQAQRQLPHDPWRLPVGRLLCHDRRTDQRNLCAGARLAQRPAIIPGPGLSVPPDAGEPGAASKQSNLAFWKMLKVGNDHFETTGREPKVDVCDRRYVFNAQPPPNSPQPLVFNANEKCPPFVVHPKSRGGRLKNSAPTSAPTRNCLKTICRLPRSTADLTAE